MHLKKMRNSLRQIFQTFSKNAFLCATKYSPPEACESCFQSAREIFDGNHRL